VKIRSGRSFAALLGVFLCAWAAANAAPAVPEALEKPALQTPRAQKAAMLAIARAGNRLVAAGERGIVLLSDDGGATWRQASVPVQVTLTTMRFVDPQIAGPRATLA